MNILEARRRTLGKGVYKKTVEGNPAIAQGSLARRYPGITMQGWTEQAQYEGNQLFDASVFDGMEKSGVSISVKDGVITATGTSETAIWIQSANMTEEDFKKIKSGNIYMKNYKTADCTYEVGIYINNTTVKEGNSPYTIPDGYLETNPNNVYFFIDVKAGVELKGSLQPIVYQDGDGTWEPYTGGAPSPSPDYPQEITSAGKYDEGTGKYQYTIKISDSEESPTKSQTVTLTSDRPLTKWDKIEKRDGVWGVVYKSGMKVIDGTEQYFIGSADYISEKSSNIYINNNDMVKGIPALKNGYCNRLTYVNVVWTIADSIGFCYNKNQIHMRISNDSLGTTSESTPQEVISAMKNYMSQQYNDGNPFVFWYETAEETFVPLSESEQEAMNELYTFRPTTVLSNNAGCNMTLTYKTKKSLEVTT